jgi:hypothetical protein
MKIMENYIYYDLGNQLWMRTIPIKMAIQNQNLK